MRDICEDLEIHAQPGNSSERTIVVCNRLTCLGNIVTSSNGMERGTKPFEGTPELLYLVSDRSQHVFQWRGFVLLGGILVAERV
jgi:hypothetical protein